MAFSHENLELPPDFSGIVRLFPLPNLVLFPGVIQGLHIFEPRYLELMKDALAADGLITIALMKPEWELAGSTLPPVHETVCIGKVLTHSEAEDGRYNLLLIGLQRARIVREIGSKKPYRLAQVDVLTGPLDDSQCERDLLRHELLEQFRVFAKARGLLENDSIRRLLEQDVPFSLLVDLLGFSTGASSDQLQDILETVNLEVRGKKVLQLLRFHLSQIQDHGADFPPKFSTN